MHNVAGKQGGNGQWQKVAAAAAPTVVCIQVLLLSLGHMGPDNVVDESGGGHDALSVRDLKV
jgi:hypothetical protein